MYLRWLKIENLKLLRNVELSFMRGEEIRPWTVFVAENGLCKTALLQAIALAASGPTLASELAEVTSYPDRRLEAASVSIQAEFSFGREHHALRKYPDLLKPPAHPPVLYSKLHTRSGWRDFAGQSGYDPSVGAKPDQVSENPLLTARRNQLPLWFVAGYGTERSLPRPGKSQDEELADPLKRRLASLFDRGSLLATGFADLFAPKLARTYWSILKQVLVEGRLLPRVTDLQLQSRGRVKTAKDLLEAHSFKFDLGRSQLDVPATWLSRGYQGTIAWLADLVGQILLEAGNPVEPEDMEGLILVDELDLHLHPRWQAQLIPGLKRVFPRLQFIATTHSAMMLPGLARDEVVLLQQDEEGSVVAEPAPRSPALLTGSELLDAFFGIDQLYPSELGEALQRYGYIASNPLRSAEEERELAPLLQTLRAAGVEPGWRPVPRKRNSKSRAVAQPSPKRATRKKRL